MTENIFGLILKNKMATTVFLSVMKSAYIYCFGTGLPILMYKHIYQYRGFKYNCKLTLQMFETKYVNIEAQ